MTTSDDQREALTREEFLAQWTSGTLTLRSEAAARGRYAIPCNCGEKGCVGWQMGHTDDVEKFIAALSSRPALPAGDEALLSFADWIEENGYGPTLANEARNQAAALASRPSSPQAGDVERQHMQSLAKWVGVDESTPSLEIACEVSAALEARTQAADERGKLIAEAREYEDALQGGEGENWLRLVDLASRLVATLESDGQEEK